MVDVFDLDCYLVPFAVLLAGCTIISVDILGLDLFDETSNLKSTKSLIVIRVTLKIQLDAGMSFLNTTFHTENKKQYSE